MRPQALCGHNRLITLGQHLLLAPLGGDKEHFQRLGRLQTEDARVFHPPKELLRLMGECKVLTQEFGKLKSYISK